VWVTRAVVLAVRSRLPALYTTTASSLSVCLITLRVMSPTDCLPGGRCAPPGPPCVLASLGDGAAPRPVNTTDKGPDTRQVSGPLSVLRAAAARAGPAEAGGRGPPPPGLHRAIRRCLHAVTLCQLLDQSGDTLHELRSPAGLVLVVPSLAHLKQFVELLYGLAASLSGVLHRVFDRLVVPLLLRLQLCQLRGPALCACHRHDVHLPACSMRACLPIQCTEA